MIVELSLFGHTIFASVCEVFINDRRRLQRRDEYRKGWRVKNERLIPLLFGLLVSQVRPSSRSRAQVPKRRYPPSPKKWPR